jgi:peptidoglycan/LPS O-acetylase OafA/YrhL
MQDSNTSNKSFSLSLPIHKSKYRIEIDGLRALAIIAVIVNHFNKNFLPSGFLGVDIFFVISGYVITSSVANRDHSSLKDFLLSFYAKRIKRIMPALIACVVITSAVSFVFIPSSYELKIIWRTGISALFGFSNLYLFNQSTNYFAASTEVNLFAQTWSLGIEKQFYLIFPLIFWFSGFSKDTNNGKGNLLFAIVFMSIISLCSYIYFFQFNQSATYFLLPFRFWELGIGCITFLAIYSDKLSSKILTFANPTIITIVLITLLFTPQFLIDKSTIAVVLLTSVLIITLNNESFIFNVFTWQPIVFVGVISYSLYLWHWSVLAISHWTIGIDWWTYPIQIATTILISSISYKYVETPLRNVNWSTSQLLTIVYGVATTCIGAFLIYILLGNQFLRVLYIGQTPDFIKTTWWHDKNGNYIEYCHVEISYSEQIFQKCILDNTKSGSQDNRHNIYMFGDSHSRNYVKGITKAFPKYNVSYITMGYSCAYMAEDQVTAKLESTTGCKSYIVRVRNFVKNEVNKGDIIFIGQDKLHQYDVGYKENILELANLAHLSGAKFIFASDVPGLITNPIDCIKKPWRQQQPEICFKTISDVVSEQTKLNEIGANLESQTSNSRYLDVRKNLCVNQRCSLYKGDMPLYHDSGHITDEASEMLSPYIREQLKSFVLTN